MNLAALFDHLPADRAQLWSRLTMYHASIYEDLERTNAAVARSFARLDFPDAPHPPPLTRLFGGEDVLVVATTEGVYLGAPNVEGYRRVVAALAGLGGAIPSEEEAHQGSFADARAGDEQMKALLYAAAASGLFSSGSGDGGKGQ